MRMKIIAFLAALAVTIVIVALAFVIVGFASPGLIAPVLLGTGIVVLGVIAVNAIRHTCLGHRVVVALACAVGILRSMSLKWPMASSVASQMMRLTRAYDDNYVYGRRTAISNIIGGSGDEYIHRLRTAFSVV